MPSVDAPLPPPVPEPPQDDEQPAIVVNTFTVSHAGVRVDPERHTLQSIGWSLALLALLGTVPVALAVLRSRAGESLQLERWALAVLMVGVLELSYAVFLLQIPDRSAARVVSIVTLMVATLYAIMAGLRMLAAPGNRVMELLELDANMFSSRQESLWCFAMVLLTGTLSYVAGRAARAEQRTADRTSNSGH